MAQAAYLYLDGLESQYLQIEGSPIECLGFQHGSTATPAPAAGVAVASRTHRPIYIRKRVDQSSPLLMNALVTNQTVSGRLELVQQPPVGDGKRERLFTLQLTDGLVCSIREYHSEADVSPTSEPTSEPTLEEITFLFETVQYTDLPDGAAEPDSWVNDGG